MDGPVVLALDLASGGATAALVTPSLVTVSSFESPWRLVDEGAGSYVLAPGTVWHHAAEAIGGAAVAERPPAAIVLTSMMHTLLVTNPAGTPRGPIRTWRDRAHAVDVSRSGLDPLAYRERTGCYLHPSFPAAKLLAMRQKRSEELDGPFRVESIKGHVHRILTGESIEDISTASASGLVKLDTGTWDESTLGALGLEPAHLPAIRETVGVGATIRPDVARSMGLPRGLPVVAGLGDGFAATMGSVPAPYDSLAVTLGTTSGTRTVRTSPHRAVDGTFCYRFGPERFLAGCASSNGGSVLDWVRTAFEVPDVPNRPSVAGTVPVFLPFLEGERSPVWNARLQPRWVGPERAATVQDLATAAIESVVFGIRFACDRIRQIQPAGTAVISGNGFRAPELGEILADVLDIPLLSPDAPGQATIRGAARVAFEALEIDTEGAMAAMLERAVQVRGSGRGAIGEHRRERYRRFEREMATVENGWAR